MAMGFGPGARANEDAPADVSLGEDYKIVHHDRQGESLASSFLFLFRIQSLHRFFSYN